MINASMTIGIISGAILHSHGLAITCDCSIKMPCLASGRNSKVVKSKIFNPARGLVMSSPYYSTNSYRKPLLLKSH